MPEMNAPETNRFDELVSRYLDDELSEDERAELLALLAASELAKRFLEITKLNAEMAGLLSAPVPDSVMVELVMSDLRKSGTADEEPLRLRLQPSEPARSITPVNFAADARPAGRQSHPQFGFLKWAAVLVALVAIGTVLFSSFWRSSDSMKVTRIEGEVYFIGDSGETRLQSNSTLGVGKVKTVGASSRAALLLTDGTRVDVGGNTLLAIHPAKDRTRFSLENGSLKSQIAKQPSNRPLVFATPEAEAIVKGTVITLMTGQHHTRLEVTEGTVLLKRQNDGAEIAVNAGYFAVVAPNAPLVAKPLHPDSHHGQ